MRPMEHNLESFATQAPRRSTEPLGTGVRGILSVAALTAVLLAATACYKVSGRYGNLPENIRSIGVPPVENKTTRFNLERLLTPDLRRALARKSAVHVVPRAEGADAVLRVCIESLTVIPTGVDASGTGTAFEVMVTLRVTFTEARTGKVILENPGVIVREPFILPDTGLEFAPEDSPALERLSLRVSEDVVMNVLESF
ncbi:MAG: LptE family protein [Acidobacteria bacterium]|nr:LptE family protein [Acidobacteriota bacterium]